MEAAVSKQDESWWEYLLVYDFARVIREEDETEQGICYFTCTKQSCNRDLICSQIPGVLRAASELAAGSKPTLVKLWNTTLAVQHHGSILLVLACHAFLPPQCCIALLEQLVYLFTMFHGPLEHVYKEESHSLKGCVKKLENGIFLKDIYLTPEEFSNLTQDYGCLPNGKRKAGGDKRKVQLSITLSDTSGSESDSSEHIPVFHAPATDHFNPRSISSAEEAIENGNDMERNQSPLLRSSPVSTETCKNGVHHIEEENNVEGEVEGVRDNECAGQKTWEVGMEIRGLKPRPMADWEENSFDTIAVSEMTHHENMKEGGRSPEEETDEQEWKAEDEESMQGIVEDLSGEMLCGTLLVLSFPPFSIVVLGRQNLRQDVHTLSSLKEAAVSTINSLVPRLPFTRSPAHNVPASSSLHQYHGYQARASSARGPNEETRKDSKVDGRDRYLYFKNDYNHSIVHGSSEILTLSTCDIFPNGLTGDPANPRPELPLLQVASMLQSGSTPLLRGMRELTLRKGKDSVFAARSLDATMTFYSPPTLPNFPYGTPTSRDSIAQLPSLARAHLNKLDKGILKDF